MMQEKNQVKISFFFSTETVWFSKLRSPWCYSQPNADITDLYSLNNSRQGKYYNGKDLDRQFALIISLAK